MPRTEAAAPTTAWRLADWLAYQEQVHPKSIALGLDRVCEVAHRLGLLPTKALTLTIGGTNGKGSSATLAAGIYQAAGYRVGRYLSPHLIHYNERIAVDGIDASDATLCNAFAAIEQARREIPLTYFEFGTLAALLVFRDAACDVQVLEVGLGGRLDAVNIVDADCALITNIGIDHTDWLGPDRDSIGYEKAGILRCERPAVCAEPQPPRGLLEEAARIGAVLAIAGRDFSIERQEQRWSWRNASSTYTDLPPPALAGEAQYVNAAGVLAAVSVLQPRVPVSEGAIHVGLQSLRLRGRYERIGRFVLDVAHNAESAQVLADNLRANPGPGRTWLVLGMLSDKPIEAVCQLLASVVDGLYFASLPTSRGLADTVLAERARAAGVSGVAAGSVAEALQQARRQAAPQDRIVICGSFLTVSAAAGFIDE